MSDVLKNRLEENSDSVPLCGDYRRLIDIAVLRFKMDVKEVRMLYGCYTYRQWNTLFKG